MDFSANIHICDMPSYEMSIYFRQHIISNACVPFSNSAVKVHNLLIYRNMTMARERINKRWEENSNELTEKDFASTNVHLGQQKQYTVERDYYKAICGIPRTCKVVG